MIRIPTYQSRHPKPAAPLPSLARYDRELVGIIGQGVQNIVGPLLERKERIEYFEQLATAKTETRKRFNAFREEIENDPEYSTFEEKWDDFQGIALDSLVGDITNERAKREFSAWYADASEAQRVYVEGTTVQRAEDDALAGSDRRLDYYVGIGDGQAALNEITDAVDAGLITRVQAEAKIQSGLNNIAFRNARMKALGMSPDEAIEWISNSENLKYKLPAYGSLEEQEVYLTLQQQEMLVADVRNLQREQLRQRRETTYEAYDEYYRMYLEVRDGKLLPSQLMDRLMADARSVPYDGMPIDLRQKFGEMVSGGGLGDEPDQQYKSAAWSIITDWRLTPDQKQDLLSETFEKVSPTTLGWALGKDLDKYSHPKINDGVQRITDMYKSITAGLDTDSEEWLEAKNEEAGRLEKWFQTIEGLDPDLNKDQFEATLEDAIKHATQRYVAGQWSEAQLRTDTPLTINDYEDALRYLQEGGGRYPVLNAETIERVGSGSVILIERFLDRKIDQEYGAQVMADGRTNVVVDGRLLTVRFDEATKSPVVQVWEGDRWVDLPTPRRVRPPRPSMPARGGPQAPVAEPKPLAEMTEDELSEALVSAGQSRNPALVQEIRDEMDRRDMTEEEEETRLSNAIEGINEQLGERGEEAVEGAVDWLKDRWGKAGRWFGRRLK